MQIDDVWDDLEAITAQLNDNAIERDNLTRDRNAAIVKIRKSGMSASVIAEKTGISRQMVTRIVNDAGLDE